jgi:hypothetical protein
VPAVCQPRRLNKMIGWRSRRARRQGVPPTLRPAVQLPVSRPFHRKIGPYCLRFTYVTPVLVTKHRGRKRPGRWETKAGRAHQTKGQPYGPAAPPGYARRNPRDGFWLPLAAVGAGGDDLVEPQQWGARCHIHTLMRRRARHLLATAPQSCWLYGRHGYAYGCGWRSWDRQHIES